jgi:hypothetical protein
MRPGKTKAPFKSKTASWVCIKEGIKAGALAAHGDEFSNKALGVMRSILSPLNSMSAKAV